MDRERKKHIQAVKLIITEIVMVIAVILTVVVLTLLAMGYNVGKDGELKQSGLIQIKSFPSGATVNIDGEDLLAHTSMSKLLPTGEHKIALKKDGYDTWEKEIVSEAGRLIKLEYPRLFLEDRKPEKVQEYKEKIALMLPAPNRDIVLIAKENNLKWELFDVRGSGAEKSELELTKILKDAKVESVKWNKNSDHLLIKTSKNDKIEWLLVDIKKPEVAVNLTKEFEMNFSVMEFAGDGSDRLFALEKDNLRIVAMGNKTVSQVLVDNIKEFAHFDDKLIYLTHDNKVKMLQEGGEDAVIAEFDKEKSVKIAISEYLDQRYVLISAGETAYIYRDENEFLMEEKLGFLPEEMAVFAEGELMMAKNGENIAMFDAEIPKMSKYQLKNAEMFVLDGYLVGTIVEGKLTVEDFDGTNIRTLTEASGPAFITKNNKWMYYLNKNNLYREQILD